jgi:hypothetical protein
MSTYRSAPFSEEYIGPPAVTETDEPESAPEPTAEQLAALPPGDFHDVAGSMWASRLAAAQSSPGGQAVQSAQAYSAAFWAPAITAAKAKD